MEADRWRRIEELYHSALARKQGERQQFLADACKDDVGLRQEVESLLGADGKATGFIEAPAIQVAAQLLTPDEIEEHAPKTLKPGTTISHYRILNKIGAGGMGEVYRAHDPRLNRDVAVKVLPETSAPDPERLRRFELEARSTAALNHPNIVAIYDVGTWEYGTPYVVSELLEGETLRECLRRGPLPVRKSVEISSHIASGLSAAHEKGIIHRDLKPENLWLTKDGQVKILDFGLAKLLPEKPVAPDLTTLTDTTSTKVMGTLGYMSPEQVRGKPLDQRTDIFSLGAVMYEMLSGRRAFQGPTPADTISAVLNRDPAELSTTNQAIPSAVGGIVHRCLEKDADQRFHTAKDVAYALAAVSPSSTAEAVQSPSAASLHWKWLLLAAVLAVVLGAFWLWNRTSGAHNVPTGAIHSIAVLPLENVSGTPDQDYFADGMTVELITELASLKDVRVISRSSVIRFRGSKQSLAEIGHLLNVDAILEGSVLRQRNRVRITAELVQVDGDRHLWAHSYDGDVSDVIRLQGEIARSVTAEISEKLLPEIQQHPRQNVPADAYDAYLKGLYFTAKLTPDDMAKGFDFFKKAINADPTFAAAYGGMAEAYSWGAGLGILPPQDALAKADAASTKALDLDADLGMAHHARAWVEYAHNWNFPAAEREFQRAIELTPNSATAHLWYGMFLAQRNRAEQSFKEMRRAQELDPLSSIVNGLSMTPLLTTRQFDKIIEQAGQGLKSNPGDGLLFWLLTAAYIGKGDFSHAIDIQQQQAIAFGEGGQKAENEFAELRHEFALHGERAYWLAQEKSLAGSPATDPYDLATVEARLGKTGAMYDSLAKAYQQRSTSLLYAIDTEPAFDRFRSEPSFKDLMRTMGLAGQT
jgi:eukaryotic-like serine/threonine-protein kinase